MARLPRLVTGINTGLGVNETYVALFEENERRFRLRGKKPVPRPRTDKEIAGFMYQEFPHKESKHYRLVAFSRWRYNHGQLYKDMKVPKIQSFRYNKRGDRVPQRYFDKYED